MLKVFVAFHDCNEDGEVTQCLNHEYKCETEAEMNAFLHGLGMGIEWGNMETFDTRQEMLDALQAMEEEMLEY